MLRKILPTAIVLLLFSPSAEALKLSEAQVNNAVKLIKYLKANHPKEDPLEYVALAWVESRISLEAVSHTGDYGILQINYRIHQKKLREELSIKSREELLMFENNVNASVFLMNAMRRKYKQCRKDKVYSCYNGGPGWKYVQRKCLESCESDKCGKCHRANRYGRMVKKIKRILKRKHSYLFRAPNN